ncbi:FKBP-type peptidyl-prolyl cis-trans isomerase [Sphingopyxis panaciterrae]|uniref:FKBP-type peptidyl-prolyl cis-trans isomerase n=1 Tax=Sphingopyxis panaciterrae TaxID=363841 RepID=UPI001420DCFB|nr:FKBP-type peptidyl-prolyl cis-trans isomerase [Sphingopyxis panaciterrae]NIJ37092.1 FKBP-type peptidyl-prolyl cis-trans isomerase [Sphingopyxis panaciterrae]
MRATSVLSVLGVMLSAASLTLAFSVTATAQEAVKQKAGQPGSTAWLNRQAAALAERNAGSGWHMTPSGLRWRRVAGDGSGARPGPADMVTVHYVGTFTDGEPFDSSVARGEPATFPLGGVIKGWQEGVALMGVGDKVEFAIPYQLAYGAGGKGPIPGGATLLFTVELLAIEPAV